MCFVCVASDLAKDQLKHGLPPERTVDFIGGMVQAFVMTRLIRPREAERVMQTILEEAGIRGTVHVTLDNPDVPQAPSKHWPFEKS